ncbi:MarR family transcriptional regulator [Paenibacillus woosongensis]|uniref:MarR family transcriptional regulator n=1 Tax=Paenibacillus woosongensis TaxID=307580 RepID=A0AA95I263_9BACL|nr:MarR family transcriptional regulator [Paenibacillus woosongensis]WHX47281.1 MarR family transcriptional regulator [Paenibacillus woosongensis]
MHTEEFGKLLSKIVKDYQNHLEEELAPTLTTSQLSVLEVLEQNGQLKPSDLIPFLATTPAAVTMLLDRMEKAELIRRDRDEEDRRIVWISITEKGKAEADRGISIRHAYLDGVLSRISTHNQQLLVYLMGKISGTK